MTGQFKISVKDGSGGLVMSLALDTRTQFNSRIRELSVKYGNPIKYSAEKAEFRS